MFMRIGGMSGAQIEKLEQDVETARLEPRAARFAGRVPQAPCPARVVSAAGRLPPLHHVVSDRMDR